MHEKTFACYAINFFLKNKLKKIMIIKLFNKLRKI